MKLYFACSLTGGRQDESVYRIIVDYLLAEGHEVPTAHLALPEVMDLEKVADAEDVYLRDTTWISETDALIAEVSTPSHGVGYEIGYALNLGKPVFCCYQEDRKVSKMILGNDSPGLTKRSYREASQAIEAIGHFLTGLKTEF
jgi:nucleoside 2-deoxyribosyltransferase